MNHTHRVLPVDETALAKFRLSTLAPIFTRKNFCTLFAAKDTAAATGSDKFSKNSNATKQTRQKILADLDSFIGSQRPDINKQNRRRLLSILDASIVSKASTLELQDREIILKEVLKIVNEYYPYVGGAVAKDKSGELIPVNIEKKPSVVDSLKTNYSRSLKEVGRFAKEATIIVEGIATAWHNLYESNPALAVALQALLLLGIAGGVILGKYVATQVGFHSAKLKTWANFIRKSGIVKKGVPLIADQARKRIDQSKKDGYQGPTVIPLYPEIAYYKAHKPQFGPARSVDFINKELIKRPPIPGLPASEWYNHRELINNAYSAPKALNNPDTKLIVGPYQHGVYLKPAPALPPLGPISAPQAGSLPTLPAPQAGPISSWLVPTLLPAVSAGPLPTSNPMSAIVPIENSLNKFYYITRTMLNRYIPPLKTFHVSDHDTNTSWPLYMYELEYQ